MGASIFSTYLQGRHFYSLGCQLVQNKNQLHRSQERVVLRTCLKHPSYFMQIIMLHCHKQHVTQTSGSIQQIQFFLILCMNFFYTIFYVNGRKMMTIKHVLQVWDIFSFLKKSMVVVKLVLRNLCIQGGRDVFFLLQNCYIFRGQDFGYQIQVIV